MRCVWTVATTLGCALASTATLGVACGLLTAFGPAIVDNAYSWARDVGYPTVYADFCSQLYTATGGFDICAQL